MDTNLIQDVNAIAGIQQEADLYWWKSFAWLNEKQGWNVKSTIGMLTISFSQIGVFSLLPCICLAWNSTLE